MSKKKKKQKKKLRVDFRKNRTTRSRRRERFRGLDPEQFDSADDLLGEERLSGKGEVARRRTVIGEQLDDDNAALPVQLDVDESRCLAGRVLRVGGLVSEVQADDGTVYHCAVRRLLKTLSTHERHVLAAGDRVLFEPLPTSGDVPEGVIVRIEPRRGVLSRATRGREHVIVANVDQLLIVLSAAEPPLKPNLIDRLLVAAEKARIEPVILINKIDLVRPERLQPLVGLYAQMGYCVLLASAASGFGLERLRRRMQHKQTALAGQSGVGKSSLLNALDPRLNIRVQPVSRETHKGRHTTTAARLYRLAFGGWVVDTPGVRQFELWDVVPEEVAGYFRDIRPFVNLCRYPDCTHMNEDSCAVKDAVADYLIDTRRYESYCHLFLGNPVD